MDSYRQRPHATTLADVFNIKLQQKEKNLPQIYWIPKLHKARFIAGSRSCTTTRLSKLITECLKLVRSHCTAYCKTIRERTGVNSMWIINNSLDVICKCVTLSLRYSWPFCHLIPLDSLSLPLILSCRIVRPFYFFVVHRSRWSSAVYFLVVWSSSHRRIGTDM